MESLDLLGDSEPVIEDLGGSRYLAVSGTGNGTVVPAVDTFSMTFGGTFSYCAQGASNDGYFECAVMPVECLSTQHRLALTPR